MAALIGIGLASEAAANSPDAAIDTALSQSPDLLIVQSDEPTDDPVAEPPSTNESGSQTLLERLRRSSQNAPEGSTDESSAEDPAINPDSDATTDNLVIDSAAAELLQQAADLATQAELMAQTAASATDWDGVMAQWLQAISLAQSVPPQSPSRIVAQRQLRGYLQQLSEAQQQAEQASRSSGLPSLGSPLFDAQLAGYLSYVATMGTPDILIVGSSRALQGIDPQAMQQRLADRGYADLSVFNFSVNGATAQVVNFMVSELLSDRLPRVIVWGDGSRAFNDGRRDRTWESILASPGYRAIAQGQQPAALFVNGLSSSNRPATPAATEEIDIAENLDALGFAAVSDRFIPQTYYRQFPRVAGRYDGAYAPFRLQGPQTVALGELASFTQAQNARLIFVNLPLSDSYLDDFRRYYERQFQQFLQTQSEVHGFDVVDLLTLWSDQPNLFADPSHINQDGAVAIATQLAQSSTLLSALDQQGLQSTQIPSKTLNPIALGESTMPAQTSSR
jgi:hypothetical protein